MTYMVVVFIEENETAIVPSNWIDEDAAWWPPYKSSTRINNSVFRKEAPGELWTKYSVRVLYTGTWENARITIRLKWSEDASDLQSEAECSQKRQPKTRHRLLSEEEEESFSEEDVPTPGPRYPPISRRKNQDGVVGKEQGSYSYPVPPRPPRLFELELEEEPQPSTSQGKSAGEPMNRLTELKQAQARDSYLFRDLQKLHQEVLENRKLLRLILSKLGRADDIAEATLPEGLSLPLSSQDEVDNAEQILDDQQKAGMMVRYLAEFSGSDVKDTVNRVMREVFTTDLAKRYNYSGQKGKMSFAALKLNTVLFRCVQRNPATKNTNRREFEDAVKKWLGGARDREGGRKKRNQQHLPVPENE